MKITIHDLQYGSIMCTASRLWTFFLDTFALANVVSSSQASQTYIARSIASALRMFHLKRDRNVAETNSCQPGVAVSLFTVRCTLGNGEKFTSAGFFFLILCHLFPLQLNIPSVCLSFTHSFIHLFLVAKFYPTIRLAFNLALQRNPRPSSSHPSPPTTTSQNPDECSFTTQLSSYYSGQRLNWQNGQDVLHGLALVGEDVLREYSNLPGSG